MNQHTTERAKGEDLWNVIEIYKSKYWNVDMGGFLLWMQVFVEKNTHILKRYCNVVVDIYLIIYLIINHNWLILIHH